MIFKDYPGAVQGDSGFTLIEALTAMTVLAISAAAFIGTAETHSARIVVLEERAAARWAAELVLAEIRAGLRPPESGEAEIDMFGSQIAVRVEMSATSDPDIRAVVLDAQTQGTHSAGARITGFVMPGQARP